MSREELQRAIRAISISLQVVATEYCEGENTGNFHLVIDHALNTALAALRAELDRVDGCEYCNDGEAMAYKQDNLKRPAYIYLDGNLLTADLYSESMAVAVCYCPMCGKKLREDKADG